MNQNYRTKLSKYLLFHRYSRLHVIHGGANRIWTILQDWQVSNVLFWFLLLPSFNLNVQTHFMNQNRILSLFSGHLQWWTTQLYTPLCTSVRLSFRLSVLWLVGHLVSWLVSRLAPLTFLLCFFFIFLSHCSWPNVQLTSNTALAHPHRTGVDIYLTLFLDKGKDIGKSTIFRHHFKIKHFR